MAEIMTEKGLSIAVLLNWLMTILMAVVTPFVISGELFIVFGGLCGVVRLTTNYFFILLISVIIDWILQFVPPQGNKRTYRG